MWFWHLGVSDQAARGGGVLVIPVGCRNRAAGRCRLSAASAAAGRSRAAMPFGRGCRQRGSSLVTVTGCPRRIRQPKTSHTQGPGKPRCRSADQQEGVPACSGQGNSIGWVVIGAVLLMAGAAYFATESLEPEQPIANSIMVMILGFLFFALVWSAIGGRRPRRPPTSH